MTFLGGGVGGHHSTHYNSQMDGTPPALGVPLNSYRRKGWDLAQMSQQTCIDSSSAEAPYHLPAERFQCLMSR